VQPLLEGAPDRGFSEPNRWGSGELAHAPRGSVHGYRNAHPHLASRALCLYTPPGYEQYFRDVHAAVEAGTEITDQLLAELRGRYATESR
jgi:hypothetical protein